jgi:hypothetical protein
VSGFVRGRRLALIDSLIALIVFKAGTARTTPFPCGLLGAPSPPQGECALSAGLAVPWLAPDHWLAAL